MAVIYTKVTTF